MVTDVLLTLEGARVHNRFGQEKRLSMMVANELAGPVIRMIEKYAQQAFDESENRVIGDNIETLIEEAVSGRKA